MTETPKTITLTITQLSTITREIRDLSVFNRVLSDVQSLNPEFNIVGVLRNRALQVSEEVFENVLLTTKLGGGEAVLRYENRKMFNRILANNPMFRKRYMPGLRAKEKAFAKRNTPTLAVLKERKKHAQHMFTNFCGKKVFICLFGNMWEEATLVGRAPDRTKLYVRPDTQKCIPLPHNGRVWLSAEYVQETKPGNSASFKQLIAGTNLPPVDSIEIGC